MSQSFTFIHAADLHLGTPFTGLAGAVPELAGELASAPFAALEELVIETLRRKAAFVVLSGDIFDTPVPSMSTGARFLRCIQPLLDAGIPIFAAAGNHDFLPLPEHLGLPEGIKFFPSDTGKAFQVPDQDGRMIATVAGISHGREKESADLVPQIVPLLKDAPGFRVAVLHANIGGQSGFQPYAPAPLAELQESGAAEYWALGHVHNHRILCEDPQVVYPGCIQGRSVNEPGARGAAAVKVSAAGAVQLEFLPLGPIVFHHLEMEDLHDISTVPELLSLIRRRTENVVIPGRKLLLRLTLRGASPLNRQLRQEDHDALHELISGQLPSGVWLESLDIATTSTTVTALSGLAAEIPAVKEKALEMLAAEAAALKLRRDIFEGFTPQEMAEIMDSAAGLLCDMLTGTGEE